MSPAPLLLRPVVDSQELKVQYECVGGRVWLGRTEQEEAEAEAEAEEECPLESILYHRQCGLGSCECVWVIV